MIRNRTIELPPNALVRAFGDGQVLQRDGREVYGRIVPYGVAARVVDAPGTQYGFDTPYMEKFAHGALKRATKAPDRVALAIEHEGADALLTQLGYGVEIREEDDGGHGVFRVFKTLDGDKALELVDAGILRCWSVGFVPLVPPSYDSDGAVVRTKVHLSESSLCRQGAYVGAEVQGRRNLSELPPEPTPWALADRLKAIGVEL